MSDEQSLWEQQDGEPSLWYDRFMAYLLMGPSRTKLGAVHLVEKAEKSREKQSTKVPGAWNDAFNQWNWKERAEAWDEYRRKQVFTQGNAYDVTRVEKLSKYSEKLEAEMDRMFEALAKKKTRKAWFNQFLYEKYLQSLEALAAETGGRTKKQEITHHFDEQQAEQDLLRVLERLEGPNLAE
jgi:hypothetical protein